ncbi:MAG: site-specific integrase [Acidobacteriia bacterium]|nr:site-specific integrase [Terriglobia bacterium]
MGEIQQGKAASKSGKEFARKPFGEAAKSFLEERRPHVSERTGQFERERLKPLGKYFGEKPLIRFKAEDIAAYQRHRLQSVAARTVNMEVSVLRRMLKRAKVWTVVAEDVRMFPEHGQPVARVLTGEQKRLLFETAASRPDWLVVHCAAVLAVSTTCRSVELKNLRWQDVDLFNRVMTIKRSKTAAGHRAIPLNSDGLAAMARLLERAQAHGVYQPEYYVFPTCEHETLDPKRPQRSWRTAWRKLLRETAKRAGREAARGTLARRGGIGQAKAAWRRASACFVGFRFHDLRHQAITELAEAGATDATLMALAGHMSRRMLEHYSHVRMAAKRAATEKLESGLMSSPATASDQPRKAVTSAVQ